MTYPIIRSSEHSAEYHPLVCARWEVSIHLADEISDTVIITSTIIKLKERLHSRIGNQTSRTL